MDTGMVMASIFWILVALAIGYLLRRFVRYYKNELAIARHMYTKQMLEFNEKLGTSFPTDPKDIDPRFILGGDIDQLLFRCKGSRLFNGGDFMYFEPTSKKVAVYRDKNEEIQVHDISWIKSTQYGSSTTTYGPGGIQSRTSGTLSVGTGDVRNPMMRFSINKPTLGFEWVARIDALLS